MQRDNDEKIRRPRANFIDEKYTRSDIEYLFKK
jgi:hypothetical protein